MTTKVHYEELLPHEFEERIAQRPIGYLPIGTLEWHGPHNALGADFIQSLGLFERAAQRLGGIVFPPVWLGPDRLEERPDGPVLMGMDMASSTTPPRPLPGSCYWAPRGLFTLWVENILRQARRAGFRCLVADGHGPSRHAWAEMVGYWERQFDMPLVSALRDFPDQWATQMDHAAKNETSIMMATRPDLVDLDQLPADPEVWPQGVAGEQPRESTASYGEELLEKSLALLEAKFAELGV